VINAMNVQYVVYVGYDIIFTDCLLSVRDSENRSWWTKQTLARKWQVCGEQEVDS